MNQSFGHKVPTAGYGSRGIIARPERSAAGNLVLRAGREREDGDGWYQTLHIVLDPDETAEFLAACHELTAYDSVAGLSDRDLDKELGFAEAAVHDDHTQGWLDHLRAEKARRARTD